MNIRFGVVVMSVVLFAGAGCFQLSSSTSEAIDVSGSLLDLRGHGLTSVPSDVFGMTSLETLDLSNNALTGALPGEIRFLKNLESLDVSDNAMTGVPAEIGQLSKLQVLDLSNNQLTGLPNELGNLSSLVSLDLRGNDVSAKDIEAIREKLTGAEILLD